jgi:hypothetical protein
MVREDVEALFHAHELIAREIEQAESFAHADNEDLHGHINGLREANNRVEELIYERLE